MRSCRSESGLGAFSYRKEHNGYVCRRCGHWQKLLTLRYPFCKTTWPSCPVSCVLPRPSPSPRGKVRRITAGDDKGIVTKPPAACFQHASFGRRGLQTSTEWQFCTPGVLFYTKSVDGYHRGFNMGDAPMQRPRESLGGSPAALTVKRGNSICSSQDDSPLQGQRFSRCNSGPGAFSIQRRAGIRQVDTDWLCAAPRLASSGNGTDDGRPAAFFSLQKGQRHG